jgi:5-methylcytosine-specific restriction endonuclease McrA
VSPIRLCNEPRCPEPATVRGRCARHATEQRKLTRSPFDAFYSSRAWRIARRRQLFEHPLCQYVLEDGTECATIADSVHHIDELTEGGAPRDPANLMSTCRPHHSKIHAQRRGGSVASYGP